MVYTKLKGSMVIKSLNTIVGSIPLVMIKSTIFTMFPIEKARVNIPSEIRNEYRYSVKK